MLKCHWIDEHGGWRKARSPRLDLTGPGQYAFRQLGLAKIGGYHPRTLQWDLKRVHPQAMLSARKWLAEQLGVRPVALVYYFGGWFVEHLNSGLEALDRIDRLSAYRDMEPPTGAYEKEVDFGGAVFAPPIRMSHDLWKRDRGRLSDDDAPAMAALAQHLVVFGSDRAGRDYRYIHIGHESHLARFCTADQLRKAIGRSYRFGPAENPDASTARSYERLIQSGEPAFHHLCASVKPRSKPRQWVQLERGIFPFQLPDGAPALVSICAPRRATNIPFCP